MRQLPVSVRRLWRTISSVSAAIAGFLLSGVATGVALETDLVDGTTVTNEWRLFASVAVPVVVVASGTAWWLAGAIWRGWSFAVTDAWLQTRHGVIQRITETIPRNRVQTITSQNGPIDRLLNLTSVEVHSAGQHTPTIRIPHLEDVTVDWLRGELVGHQSDSQPHSDPPPATPTNDLVVGLDDV